MAAVKMLRTRLQGVRRQSEHADPAVPLYVESLLRRFYDALNERNLPALEELLGDAPGHEGPRKIGGFRTTTGREAILTELRAWLDSWADYRAEPTEIRGTGKRFVVSTTAVGRQLGNAMELRSEAADIFAVESGKIASLRLRVNRSAVLGELGLAG